MDVDKTNFKALPFSKLFQHYTSGSGSIFSFFETDPASVNNIAHSLESFNFGGDRRATKSLLEHFNNEFLNSETTQTQIDKFDDEQCLAVVTGQQVALFGGPLYTVYKTLTAIVYANRLEKITGRPVVPIFWLADEDHDLDEVSTIKLPDDDRTRDISYLMKSYEHAPPAATIHLGEKLEPLIEELKTTLIDTDFSDQLMKLINQCYNRERTFGEAFGGLLMSLFSEYGLLIAGSRPAEAKEAVKDILKTAVNSREQITEALDETTYSLRENGYHDQVQIQPSNLFYLTDAGNRVKIQYVDGTWSIPDKQWNTPQLEEEIDNHPERFSPNVFLRPICQDQLLPVAAYVGGPGEIAYYAQMKEFYKVFDHKMPAILPRFSITIFESAIDRILDKLPFDWPRYRDRIEDLEKEFVESNESVNIEKIFGIWRSQIDELSRAKRDEIGDIDPSLKGSVGKAKAAYFSELDKLKGKVYRSVKDQEQVQLDRIRRIKNHLFPNNNLQEREIGFIYFMNKYGMDIWDTLLSELSEEEPFEHLTIHL